MKNKYDLIEDKLIGDWIPEIDSEFGIGCLQGVNRKLIFLLGLACNIENSSTINEDTLVFNIELPVHVEPLWCFQPVLQNDGMSFVKFGLAAYLEVFCSGRKGGCADESVEEG